MIMDKSNLKPGHLRRIKSLALLNDEQLAAFLDYVEVVTCGFSETLFREGQRGDSMFLILEGQMRVYTEQKSGEVLFLRMLDAGDAFGEVALLNQAARSASVEAVRESVLIKITSASLQKLVSEQPAVASRFLLHLAKTVGRQLGDLTKKLRAKLDQPDMLSFLQ
jgi:CRP-like cAMP-binding protein